jgi:hypothetical protein
MSDKASLADGLRERAWKKAPPLAKTLTPDPFRVARLAHASQPRDQPLRQAQESAAWQRYLQALEEDRRLAVPQARALRELWRFASERVRCLRYPAAGVTADGDAYLSWAYRDLPRITLNVVVLRDGRLEWAFVDSHSGVHRGSEDPVAELPDEAVTELRRFARR